MLCRHQPETSSCTCNSSVYLFFDLCRTDSSNLTKFRHYHNAKVHTDRKYLPFIARLLWTSNLLSRQLRGAPASHASLLHFGICQIECFVTRLALGLYNVLKQTTGIPICIWSQYLRKENKMECSWTSIKQPPSGYWQVAAQWRFVINRHNL